MSAPFDPDSLQAFPLEDGSTTASSEIDQLEVFRSENELWDARQQVPQVVPPAVSTTGRRLLAVGSLAAGLAVGVVWLAARPTPIADGATVGGPPASITREMSAKPPELALAVARPPLIEPDAAPEELVTSELEAEMGGSDGAQQDMLSLGDSGVGTDVVARQLVGRADSFASGSTVAFWTLVLGGRPGEEVRHVWLRDGRTVSVVNLRVGGPQWRTYSRLRLEPDVEGNWVVEARDSHERVLARHRFLIEPSS
jgi:hypothetical protein